MPSELDIMVSGLQLMKNTAVPSTLVDSLMGQTHSMEDTNPLARVYYSVLDKSHGDMAIWFLYVKGFIMGVQVFYPKIEHLWKFAKPTQGLGTGKIVGRYQGNAGNHVYSPPIYGPGYGSMPRNGRPAVEAVRQPAVEAVRQPAVEAARQPAVEAARVPPTGKPKAMLGRDVFIYSKGYATRMGISDTEAKMVPRLIDVRGIPGTGVAVSLRYDGGTRFKNNAYRIEAYSERGVWYWALYPASGTTRIARKATEPGVLITDRVSGETAWSFQKQGPNLQNTGFVYEVIRLTITNAGTSRDVVAIRALASYLPPQPRRLAARLEGVPVESSQPLLAIMADLGDIKRALNGASLLSKT
jgi:hypothetical protein